MIRRLAVAATILIVTAATAIAGGRAPTATELSTLKRDVSAFNRATEQNDAAKVIGALPPRVIPSFSKGSNLSSAQVRDTLVQNARAFGAQADPRGMTADLTDLSLTDVKTRHDGTLSWGLVKLSGTAMSGSKRVAFSTTALALLQEKQWYFARIDGAGQAQLIRQAYPELKGLPKSR